jgi:glycosyltransferase involved in cell wall biosynthesis
MIELVAAWRQLKKEFPQLHMLMVGPFEEGDPVPSDVEQTLRNDERIHLAGHVPGGPAAYFAAMDMLALPSYREGFGDVLVEAAAMEIPSVATRIPGIISAVADGVSGTLVPPYDADALAEALRAYILDPELRQKHGRQGRERAVREFPEERIWELQTQTYRRLLAERGLL